MGDALAKLAADSSSVCSREDFPTQGREKPGHSWPGSVETQASDQAQMEGAHPLRDSPSCLRLPGVHGFLPGGTAGPALITGQGTNGRQPGQGLRVNDLVSKVSPTDESTEIHRGPSPALYR